MKSILLAIFGAAALTFSGLNPLLFIEQYRLWIHSRESIPEYLLFIGARLLILVFLYVKIFGKGEEKD